MKKLLLIIALLLPLPPLQASLIFKESLGVGILAGTAASAITAGTIYTILKKKNAGNPLTKKEKIILAMATALPFTLITGASGIFSLSKLFANNDKNKTKNQTPPQQPQTRPQPTSPSAGSKDQPATGTVKNGAKTAESKSSSKAKNPEIPLPQEALPTPSAQELAQQAERKAQEEQANKDREAEQERLRKQKEQEEKQRLDREKKAKEEEDKRKKDLEETEKKRLEEEQRKKDEAEKAKRDQEEKDRKEKEEREEQDRLRKKQEEEEQKRKDEAKRLEEECKKKEVEEKQKAEEEKKRKAQEEKKARKESVADALKKLDLDKIKQLVKEPWFNHKKYYTKDGLTPLGDAISTYADNAGDPAKQTKADEIAQFLIQNGAKLDDPVEKRGSKKLFQHILEKRYLPNGYQPARYFEKISLIKKMVTDWGLKLSEQEKDYLLVDNANFQDFLETPLSEEEQKKNREVINFLKNELKADIDRYNAASSLNGHKTALIDAITYDLNAKNRIKFLLELGADPNKKNDSTGLYPLHVLASLNKQKHGLLYSPELGTVTDVAQLLLDKGADINAQSFSGITPLMTAVSNSDNDPTFIEFLLNNGAHINASIFHDIILSHYAWGYADSRESAQRKAEFIKLLQAKGADINCVIPNGKYAGKTPLALARSMSEKSNILIQALIDCGAKD